MSLSWVDLYIQHKQDLHQFLLQLTKDIDLSQDLYQQGYEKLATTKTPVINKNPMGYIKVMLRNLYYDYIEKEYRHTNQLIQELKEDAYKENLSWDILIAGKEEGEVIHCLEHALEKLLPEERSVLEAYYFLRKDIAQIAHDKGKTTAAIKMQLTRIRKKLRVNMIEYCQSTCSCELPITKKNS
ncbi:MAG: sigma-70 family RNA polymerase sigma factor [Candidatus Hydrogenedentota bacterium]|nr:MAG: sigma-70 family RNA polymerase sigma factor [Candidatus Hydrogenedentota bacterium]